MTRQLVKTRVDANSTAFQDLDLILYEIVISYDLIVLKYNTKKEKKKQHCNNTSDNTTTTTTSTNNKKRTY